MSEGEQLYDVFMIDPPWPKKKGGRRNVRPGQGRSLDYQVLPLTKLFMLVEDILTLYAKPMHSVFLWTIDEFLQPAELMLEHWGYRRHARIIWDKGNGIAPAFTLRFSHEYLLWYYKPKLLKIAREAWGKYTTVIQENSREHSRKPEAAYHLVEALYPNARRYDVFSRETRTDWDAFGDEIGKFDTED